jgi:hypothetical protein
MDFFRYFLGEFEAAIASKLAPTGDFQCSQNPVGASLLAMAYLQATTIYMQKRDTEMSRIGMIAP